MLKYLYVEQASVTFGIVWLFQRKKKWNTLEMGKGDKLML